MKRSLFVFGIAPLAKIVAESCATVFR